MTETIIFLKRNIMKFFRRIWYLAVIYLTEKPRGLDFHRPDWKLQKESKGKNKGYAITPGGH